MLPETLERRTVELYRAVRFPNQWRRERILLRDVRAVDPTLLEYDGRFWLFAAVSVPGAPICDELSLFYAESLLGDWQPHPANPIVSDVRRARPAGRIIRCQGHLIRPGQDCSERYGGAVVFNRITRLTPSEYAEVPIGRLRPRRTWRTLGAHTFNAADGYEVVDYERWALWRPRWWPDAAC
jgi:hypothetical protein